MPERVIERKPRLPFGAYSEIARRCNPPVTVGHARLVYLGARRSPNVEAVIEEYLEELRKSGELEGVAAHVPQSGCG